MSTWRRKAIEVLPELTKEFEDPTSTAYDVFMEMLPAAIDAHKINDRSRLQEIYGYAEWCFTQKHKDLWNAAGVVFYEHLVDYEESKYEFPKYVSRDIYNEIRDLVRLRVSDEEIKNIDKLYR